MNLFTTGWYLIYTRPQQEKKLASRLSQLQIRHFLPTAKSVRQWHDRKKIVYAPVFPSYLFVHLESSNEFYQALELDGACYYIKFDNKPAIIPQHLIDKIRLLTSEGEDVQVSHGYFSPGQSLIIEQGALAGLTGEVVQYNGKRKILVRINLLNSNILADLPSAWCSAGNVANNF
jgi:transcription antitermination factor NusG